ncbi:MAG: PDC sensor domain-containing protein, partial [Treponema sp.]|nr:PDC sensor domain-containing protein [Treponema sp.]
MAMLDDHANMARYTAAGIAFYMEQEEADSEELQVYFKRTADTLSDVSFLSYFNNIVWDQEGGFFVTAPGFIPSVGYDHTQRSWFIDAKNAQGHIAYSEPYKEASTGMITIAISMIVYDNRGQDIGVVSVEVTVNSLETMIQSNAAS